MLGIIDRDLLTSHFIVSPPQTLHSGCIVFFSCIRLYFCLKYLDLKLRVVLYTEAERENQVEGKAGIKAILQCFDPFPPALAKPHLDVLILD